MGISPNALSFFNLGTDVPQDAFRQWMLSVEANVRDRLTANRTYYVRTDGSDSNTGLANSPSGAFLTIQKAVDVAAQLDAAGFTVTIQIADGIYTGPVSLRNVVGVSGLGQLVIQGNPSTPSNVHLNVTGSGFSATNIASVWDIKDLKISATGSALRAIGSTLRFGNITFGVTTVAHMFALNGGNIYGISGYRVSGGAAQHVYADTMSVVDTRNLTCTFEASVAFSTTVYSIFSANVIMHGMTFSYGAFTVTGARYNVSYSANIYTGGGGANYFPGNSAGTGTNSAAAPYGNYI